MMSLAAAAIAAGIASNWRDALLMPADCLIDLLDAMRVPQSPSKKESGSKMQTRPDGSRQMNFGSIAELGAALAGSGWSGIKIGGK
jgi:hypothetical protein